MAGQGHLKCYFEGLSSVLRCKLASFMLTVAEEEQNIEKQRQQLCTYSGFEPYAAFSRIDRDNMGFICGKEIQEFLL